MGILNYGYIFAFGNPRFSFGNFSFIAMVEVVSFTLGSGMIPLLLFTLVHFLRMEVQRRRSDSLSMPIREETQSTRLNLYDGGEEIQVDLREVFLIESMGNYMKIYESRNGVKKTRLVRLTMKRLEQLIQQHKFMLRVHRSYIVNTSHIEQVQRSSFGDLSINFQYRDKIIPVSRNKKKELNNILKSRNVTVG